MKLVLKNIYKQYGKKLVLEDIDIVLENGIYGLLGQNGAGKTTLISIIVGLLNPTKGEVLCDGILKEKMKTEYYDYIGYMPQYPGYYNNFSAYEMLDYYAQLKGIKKKEKKARIDNLLEFVNLTDCKKIKVGKYSGGMKQRLGIAAALLNNPSIIILDEPTAGLDPKERIRFRNLLSRISEDRIIIIATHIVSDVEYIANKILLLNQGKIIKAASVDELCQDIFGNVWQLETDDKRYVDEMLEKYNVSNVYEENHMYTIRFVSDQAPECNAKKVYPKLEEVFLFWQGR